MPGAPNPRVLDARMASHCPTLAQCFMKGCLRNLLFLPNLEKTSILKSMQNNPASAWGPTVSCEQRVALASLQGPLSPQLLWFH